MRKPWIAPTVPGMKANADAFKIYYYNNLIPSDDPVTLASELLTDEIRPHELWKALTVASLPDLRWCQNWIITFVTDRLEELLPHRWQSTCQAAEPSAPAPSDAPAP